MSFRNDNTPSGMVAVTPSDTAFHDLIGFQVGGAGVVSVLDSTGVTTSITCVAGQIISCRIQRINSTSTTATIIVGFKA